MNEIFCFAQISHIPIVQQKIDNAIFRKFQKFNLRPQPKNNANENLENAAPKGLPIFYLRPVEP